MGHTKGQGSSSSLSFSIYGPGSRRAPSAALRGARNGIIVCLPPGARYQAISELPTLHAVVSLAPPRTLPADRFSVKVSADKEECPVKPRDG